jgi:hypothetical protein
MGVDAVKRRMCFVLGAWCLAGFAWADPWYNTNSFEWAVSQPDVGSIDGKAYPKGYKNAELSARQGWVELTGGRGLWDVSGAVVRSKSAQEIAADQAVADQRREESRVEAAAKEMRRAARAAIRRELGNGGQVARIERIEEYLRNLNDDL